MSGNRGPQGGIFLAGNAVNGNMTVTDNKIEVTPAGGVFVGANTVTGRLTCTNNDFFFANGNTAAVLSGQCAVT